MRVLLVEDNALNAELFVAAVETDGHSVTIERDGMSGRERALHEDFDLIVLDIQMPGMNGIDVLRSLRAAGLTTRVYALSAAALPDQIAAALAAGFDDYLAKPISPKALRARLRAR